MNEKNVFVTQYVSNVDVAEVEKFGTVIWCTLLGHKAEPTPAEKNDYIRQDIKIKMSKYMQGTDFILLNSSAIPNMITGSMLQTGEHNILKWSNQDKRYRLHKVNIKR